MTEQIRSIPVSSTVGASRPAQGIRRGLTGWLRPAARVPYAQLTVLPSLELPRGRMGSEQEARITTDRLFTAAGWTVQDFKVADIHGVRGVVLPEFAVNDGFAFPFADYLLDIDGIAAGVIGPKNQGATLTGMEIRSARYAQCLPASLHVWRRALPFIHGPAEVCAAGETPVHSVGGLMK